MLCLLSFLVFGFLGIFFAEYRELARESFNCFTQRIRTGKCEADFEDRLKATIIGRAMEKDRRLARLLSNYMEYITWILLILLLVSAAVMVLGFYNFLVHGDCSPATQGGCTLSKASKLNITAEIRESINFWLPK
ncbi:MAG: hypothetical protein ABEK10_01650 [Candidatus Nanosalina sp.]